MGSKYPIMKPREVIKKLESMGFKHQSQKGSHAKYNKGKELLSALCITKLLNVH
jgi:predicted RNA binding protein YcfA (HicA-like mRNA interferase family)